MKPERTFPRLSSALPALLLALGVSLALKVGWRIVDPKLPVAIAHEAPDTWSDLGGVGFQSTQKSQESPKKNRDAPPSSMMDAQAEALVTSSSPHVPAPELTSHAPSVEDSDIVPSGPRAIRLPMPDESRPPGAGFDQPPFAPRAPPFATA